MFIMAYFQNSESNFDQLCQKAASINRELELKAPNAELEEVARMAEVLQRVTPSQVMLKT